MLLTLKVRILGELSVIQQQLLCLGPRGGVVQRRHRIQNLREHFDVALPQRLGVFLATKQVKQES